MRDSNHCFAASNRASVVITSSLYDRRALDTTSALPLLNSLTHLTYLTSTSPRIREILTLDGGLERLLHILRNSSIPRPPPPAPDLYGLSFSPAIPASTGLLSADRAIAYRFSLAFQCVSNVGVRGSEQIRTRVVQAGVLDVVAQVLEVWLKSRGLSIEAGSTGMPGPGGSSSTRRDHSSRRRAAAASDARATADGSSATVASVSAPPPSPAAIIAPPPPQAVSRPAPPSVRQTPDAQSAGLHEPVSAIATSSSLSTTVALARSADSGIGSVPTSGDEEAEMNDEDAGTGNEDEMDVDARAGAIRTIAASDQETGRLADMASSALQAMMDGGSRDQAMSDPTPRPQDAQLPISIPPRHRPAPTPGSSIGSQASIEMAAPVASSSTSRLNPSVISRTRPGLNQADSSGHASGTSSPGASNVSTPMGTPTGSNVRERSGTLLARPPTHLAAARRRNRRDRAASGNESGTTGGEDEETVDGDGGGEEGDEERAPAQQNELSPSAVTEVGIVEDEDSATEIGGHLEQLEGNVDLQMGAPPGAPGAVTPRTGADATPRQAFLPLTATGGAPAGLGVGATPGMGVPDAPAVTGPTPPTVRMQAGLFPPNTLMAAPPAIVALATAQATQRTLRDLSLEGNVQTPSETTYRDDDILLSLQLLAYLSKYPHVRQAFHRPREPFHPTLDLRVRPGDPPLPMRAPLSTTPNIFSLVERFTFRPSPTDPTIPQLPEEIVYWAGVIMRNACRKDESRGGIRQCANMTCGKWETLPRQFAKCRRCRKAKYCSKDCQSKAWSEGHRFWCSQRGEGEGSHADASQSSVASGVPPSVMGAVAATDGDGAPPGHHHHHHHHNPGGGPQPPTAAEQAIRRQVQDVFANQPGPILRPPSPVRPPRVGYVGQQRPTPQATARPGARPASTEPMDVDMDDQPTTTQPPRAPLLRAPVPSPNRITVPTVSEPRRTSWSWGTLSRLEANTETNNLYAPPSVAAVQIPGSRQTARRSPSNSPQNPTAPLPSSSHQEPQPATRSSILAPTGALARAFNFAVPRLNTGGQDRGGPSSASAGPSSGGSGSGGEERTRRGFFRGLSGGSGDRDRDDSRSSSRGGGGGDMDI